MLSYFLEFLPLVAFFSAYHWYDLNTAIVVLGVCMLLLTAYHWVSTKQLPKMIFFSTLLIIITGGFTIYLKDPKFIQLKPTILYLLFAASLYLLEKYKNINLFEKAINSMPGKQFILNARQIYLINLQWVILFIFLAVLNYAVYYYLSFEVWLNFKVFGLLFINVVFVLFQGIWIYNSKTK